MTAQPVRLPRLSPAILTLAAGALALLFWVYWTTFGEMAFRWAHDPQYSHGYLVPGFALYLLWLRRKQLRTEQLTPNVLGLALILVAVALRLGGTWYHYGYLDQISIVPCIAGLVMLAGGWAALAWAWPAVAFLIFMVPLPYSWSLALSGPMQSFATTVSTFCLQVVGRPALAEGNVILLNEEQLNIVEACSGLRMLVVFFALATAVAMLIRKPLWERLLVVGSAVPIALAANVLRITITGLYCDLIGNTLLSNNDFHDVAGWLMMPLGLAFLGLELLVLKKLLIELPPAKLLPSQISLQRVEVNPVALYRGAPTSRRERRAAAPPAVPEPPAPVEQPAAESAAQS